MSFLKRQRNEDRLVSSYLFHADTPIESAGPSLLIVGDHGGTHVGLEAHDEASWDALLDAVVRHVETRRETAAHNIGKAAS